MQIGPFDDAELIDVPSSLWVLQRSRQDEGAQEDGF